MAKKRTSLEQVKEVHGGKEQLVDKIMALIEVDEEERLEVKKKLLGAANSKLLRVLQRSEILRNQYGSKDQLAEAVAQSFGRSKDSDYLNKLKQFTTGRLLDMAHNYQSYRQHNPRPAS